MQQCMKLTDTNRSRACSQAAAGQQLGKDRKAIVCGLNAESSKEVKRMKKRERRKERVRGSGDRRSDRSMYAVLNVHHIDILNIS